VPERRRDPFRDRNNATEAAEMIEDAIDRAEKLFGVTVMDYEDGGIVVEDRDGNESYVDNSDSFEPANSDTIVAVFEGLAARIEKIETYVGIADYDADDSGNTLNRRVDYLEGDVSGIRETLEEMRSASND
jgi:hypothetical protein